LQICIRDVVMRALVVRARAAIMMRYFRWCAAAAMAIAAAGLLLPADALAAGGAFFVDDAAIGKPGDCKVESWVSFASNHDLTAVTQPACVVNFGIPVETGATLVRIRNEDGWSTGAGPKVKVNILPIGNNGFGLGFSAATLWNLGTGQNVGSNINVPATIQASKDVRINVNAGWLYDAVVNVSYGTWGAGFEWNFVQPLTLIGEVFGLAGPQQDVRTVTEPRVQVGLRWTPVDAVDLDLIYGRNIYGENANWFTLGLNLRF
jgi:hypothetical protein